MYITEREVCKFIGAKDRDGIADSKMTSWKKQQDRFEMGTCIREKINLKVIIMAAGIRSYVQTTSNVRYHPTYSKNPQTKPN